MGNKIFGFIVAVIGLVILVSAFLREQFFNFIPVSISKNDLIVTGVIVIIIGSVISLGKTKKKVIALSEARHVSQEVVPIYEGSGANRRIVGYQKAN